MFISKADYQWLKDQNANRKNEIERLYDQFNSLYRHVDLIKKYFGIEIWRNSSIPEFEEVITKNEYEKRMAERKPNLATLAERFMQDRSQSRVAMGMGGLSNPLGEIFKKP